MSVFYLVPQLLKVTVDILCILLITLLYVYSGLLQEFDFSFFYISVIIVLRFHY